MQCYEDFPETYRQLRKQQEKYIKGGCQYILSSFGTFLKSKQPHWFEKLDLVLWCSNLFLPAFYVTDVEVINITSTLLIIAAIFQIFDGTQAVGIGALRGLEDAKIPTIITFHTGASDYPQVVFLLLYWI